MKWSYTDEGEGPVVVLLHGLASEAAAWGPLSTRLVSNFRVISIDLPGYSTANLEGETMEIESLAAAMVTFIEELSIRSCVLIGHSFGGSLAMAMAVLAPKQCVALVLIAPGGFGIEINPFVALAGTRLGSILLSQAYGPRRSAAIHRLAANYGRRHNELDGGRIDGVIGTYERLASANARKQFHNGVRLARHAIRTGRSTGTKGLPDRLPVLIIWGTDDLILPAWHAQKAAAVLPHSTMLLIAGAGHNPHRTRPAETMSAIVSFLGSEDVRARVLDLEQDS